MELADEHRERKFRIALALYAALAAAVWCTLGRGTILIVGRLVELRLVPLFVIGMFAARTLVAHEAEKARRKYPDEGGEGGPR